MNCGHSIAWLIEVLCTSRKIASSIPDEVIEFFRFSKYTQPHRNYYHRMFLRSIARLAYKVDNLTATFEPIV
jgi:hypothetical protein